MANSKTKRLGLIGNPVGHSMSPDMHNSVFRSMGLDYVYEAFRVEKDELGDFIENANKSGFVGLNVTIPHKVEVMKYLDDLSEEAELIGAVNTIKFENGKTTGYNTDGIGCIRALEAAGEKVGGRKVLMLGAGGAARSIAFQCALGKAVLSISNREVERYMAENLAKDIEDKVGSDVEVVTLDNETIARKLEETDIMIHTTPVGMYPKTDASIIPAEILPANLTVMDIVYNPMETKLLRDAKNRGCKTVSGVGMFVQQGAEALRIWLGIEAPVKEMEGIVREKLNG